MTKPLLIFDLDETLIHAIESELDLACDFRFMDFWVYRRPFLDQLLSEVSLHYELAPVVFGIGRLCRRTGRYGSPATRPTALLLGPLTWDLSARR